MKASQIIQIDAQKSGIEPKKALAMLNYQAKQKQNLIVQKNDSLMVLTAIAPDTVEGYLITADKPMALSKSLMQFWEEIQKHDDIQIVYGQADEPNILKLMKLVGWPIEDSDNPKYKWMARK